MIVETDPKARGPPPKLSYKDVMRKHREEAAANQRRQEMTKREKAPKTDVKTPKEAHKSENDEKQAPPLQVSSNAKTTSVQISHSPPLVDQAVEAPPLDFEALSLSTPPPVELPESHFINPARQHSSLSPSADKYRTYFNKDAPAFEPHHSYYHPQQHVVSMQAETLGEHGAVLLQAFDIMGVKGTSVKLSANGAITVGLPVTRIFQWNMKDDGPQQSVLNILQSNEAEILKNIHRFIVAFYKSIAPQVEPVKPPINHASMGNFVSQHPASYWNNPKDSHGAGQARGQWSAASTHSNVGAAQALPPRVQPQQVHTGGPKNYYSQARAAPTAFARPPSEPANPMQHVSYNGMEFFNSQQFPSGSLDLTGHSMHNPGYAQRK